MEIKKNNTTPEGPKYLRVITYAKDSISEIGKEVFEISMLIFEVFFAFLLLPVILIQLFLNALIIVPAYWMVRLVNKMLNEAVNTARRYKYESESIKKELKSWKTKS